MRPLGDSALMLGYREDAVEVLDAVDVLIHPSAVDAFPTSPLEAMAASVPVVATRVGGIPEAVLDGETGLLIPAPPDPDDLAGALARLLDDGKLRRRLGAGGRARYEAEFTVAVWVERLRAVYESALSYRKRA
jgi:glycosyltransferase involved in cell wall biosynthesis